MKKLIGLATGLLLLAACQSQQNEAKKAPQFNLAYYTDWDRAIRIDADLQNMYLNTPQRIEKPIDMYLAMALALKYNYTRRMISYQETLLKAGQTPSSQLSDILTGAGYINTNNSSQLSPDLKVAWNILDLSTVYYQNSDTSFKAGAAFEQSRKVIHNIMQETRLLYWKTLTAQRLLPVIDEMTEFMTLEVDEMNSAAKELASRGEAPSREDLIKKRKYMESVKNLASLKRDMETAPARLASLMGLHPSTTYKLIGAQYGNFELPEIRSNLGQLEWLALSNRPELRLYDLAVNNEELELIIQQFHNDNQNKYKDNQQDKQWSKQGCDVGINLIEEVRKSNSSTLATIRRQRMTSLILNQVYISWAQYMAAVEDYQINMEIAGTSENIAEDLSFTNGTKNEQSQLEAARAVEDEVKAFLSYVDVQESLGNLYATIGLDALPYYMLGEKPSKIAVYLHNTLEKWGKGDFLPDNRPYLLNIPSRRPPVDISSSAQLPNVTVETGQTIDIEVPLEIFDGIEPNGNIKTQAGLIDDSRLPKWLNYNEEKHTFNGKAMPNDGGKYKLKVYGVDDNGKIGYATFDLTVKEVYVPSMRLRGLTDGRGVTVLKRCKNKNCRDDYIDQNDIGREVEKLPHR